MLGALFIASLLVPASVRADLSDFSEGIGPVIAVSRHRSLALGWEVTGGMSPFVKLSLGGIYRLAKQQAEPFGIHYLAFEPWLIVGGTLGVALASAPPALRIVGGVWEGFAAPLKHGIELVESMPAHRHIWAVTVAIGWRGFGEDSELYFTPKLWRFQPYVVLFD